MLSKSYFLKGTIVLPKITPHGLNNDELNKCYFENKGNYFLARYYSAKVLTVPYLKYFWDLFDAYNPNFV